MELYLIRHGIAVERGIHEQDYERPLTPKGRDRTYRVAQRLSQLGLQFDLILTSPFLRALQTAEILHAAGLSESLQASELLQPDRPIEPWLRWLSSSSPNLNGLALVGHEPNWSLWTAQLMFGQPLGHLKVKKAGIIGLSLPGQGTPLGNSELFWLAPPRLLL